jgi:putative MATE family efflux protein
MNSHSNFTSAPLPGLIRQLAVPASVGFIFNTLFNVADTWYGGLISTKVLAALSLSFPVFFIILAMGTGLGTGTTALISHALGAGKLKEARLYGIQAISFAIVNSILLTVVGFLIAPLLFRIMGAEGEYLDTALRYMRLILCGTLFFLMNNIFNAFLTSRGDTRTYRNFLFAGFLLNLGFDPWFMFGGLGMPALGIGGIALSTVMIQFIGMFYLLYVVRRRGVLLHLDFRELIPRKLFFTHLFKQGFPASLNMMTVALGIFIITAFAGRFGAHTVAAFGIAIRIEQMALLPTIGLNIATLTLTGQNMGASMMHRVYETWKLSMTYGISIILIGSALVYFFSAHLVGFFTGDDQVISIGVEYLHVAVFYFLSYIILNISVSTMQGMKKPMFAIWIGLYRRLLVPLPLFYFLAEVLNWGTKGIWWSLFIVNWTAAVYTFFYTRKKISQVARIHTSNT